MDIKDEINEWLDIDAKIKESQNEIKLLREKKQTYEKNVSVYTQLDWCQTKRGESKFGNQKFRGARDTGTPTPAEEKSRK